MITGFRHTGIVVEDLAAAEAFWRDLMGFTAERHSREDSEYIDKILGLESSDLITVKLASPDGTVIELLKFNSHPSSPAWVGTVTSTGLTHVALTVENIHQEYVRLTTAGVSFLSRPTKSPHGGALVAFCYGPEGLVLELVEEV